MEFAKMIKMGQIPLAWLTKNEYVHFYSVLFKKRWYYVGVYTLLNGLYLNSDSLHNIQSLYCTDLADAFIQSDLKM